jgi:hypothetical protein
MWSATVQFLNCADNLQSDHDVKSMVPAYPTARQREPRRACKKELPGKTAGQFTLNYHLAFGQPHA